MYTKSSNCKKIKKNEKIFKRGIDKLKRVCYNTNRFKNQDMEGGDRKDE